jgi:hypothetical protein
MFFSGFVFPEDEESEDKNGDLVKFCGTKKYLASLNKTVDSYEKEKVRLLLHSSIGSLVLISHSLSLIY